MKTISDSYIALALTQDIQEIAKPLNDLLGISGFCYHKIFPDGSEICLSNTKRWVEHYHKNYFTLGVEYSKFITPQNYKSFLWPIGDTNGVFTAVRKIWGFTYGISLTNGQNEYFGFAKEGGDISIINTYLNSLDELERFCKFFSERAEKIIQKASQNIILFNQDHLVLYNQTNKQKNFNKELPEWKAEFKKSTPVLNYPNFLKNNKKFKLTHRELDCLRLLIRGYTAKEIAYALGISFRTVETHLENLKSKTGIAHKSKLIKFIFENEFENLL